MKPASHFDLPGGRGWRVCFLNLALSKRTSSIMPTITQTYTKKTQRIKRENDAVKTKWISDFREFKNLLAPCPMPCGCWPRPRPPCQHLPRLTKKGTCLDGVCVCVCVGPCGLPNIHLRILNATHYIIQKNRMWLSHLCLFHCPHRKLIHSTWTPAMIMFLKSKYFARQNAMVRKHIIYLQPDSMRPKHPQKNAKFQFKNC